MSRSGYSDDAENVSLWRGAVASSIRGRRGQAFLREMLAAMDGLPEKRLISEDLEKEGAVCAIGAVGLVRGVDMSKIDPEDNYAIADAFGIAHVLACEIMYLNDEYEKYDRENRRWITDATPEERFTRMRNWIVEKIDDPKQAGQPDEQREAR